MRLLLPEHHKEIEAACTALLDTTYAEDPRELVAQYRRFECALLEHLAAEEELIVPIFGEHAPAEAAKIFAEHAELREALSKLGLEVELHVVRASSVHALVEALRAHGFREDAAMYPWARAHLPLDTRRQLFVRIGRSLRGLIRRNDSTLGAGEIRHTGYSR